MRIIRRTFANLSKSTLLLGRAGENLVTKLEIDVSKELYEFPEASFELILKMPVSDDPYPVLVDVTGGKMIYRFTGSDLAKEGDGRLEALVTGADGELLKSTTANTRIDPSIIPATYPGPLEKVISDMWKYVESITVKGAVKVVEYYSDLPADADADSVAIVMDDEDDNNNAHPKGFYVKQDAGWVLFAPYEAAITALQLVAHNHPNLGILDLFGVDNGNPTFGDRIIDTFAKDTLIPLQLGETYDTLSIREDWQDVPVYVLDSVFHLALSDTDGTNAIYVDETMDYDTGMPVQLLKVRLDGSLYACFPRDVQGIATFYEAGWYDENDDPCDAPTLAGLTFDKMVVGNTTYTDLADLPPKAQSALETLSRMVNVSNEAMGLLGVVDNGVERFFGVFAKNRKYHFYPEIDCTFAFPDASGEKEDVQLVLYADCASGVDFSFPAGVIFAGDAPNSDTGSHKLICTYLVAAGVWSVGGIDYEAVT